VSGKLRIIGGMWRSRQIVFSDAPGLRPTPGRVRETLFNWLQTDIANSRCLDLYAGSGALGFEAASRGAKQVVLVENHAATCQKLRENITTLGAEQISIAPFPVERYLQSPAGNYDLVFLDPPFGEDRVSPTCQLLEARGWLADYAKIYVEAERSLTLADMPGNWRLLKNKAAGQVGFYLFQRGSL
jgi:16S rRNA (guanine966-N2)-methyltransferase